MVVILAPNGVLVLSWVWAFGFSFRLHPQKNNWEFPRLNKNVGEIMKKYVYRLNPIIELITTEPLAGIKSPKDKWSNKNLEYLKNRNAILDAVENIIGDPFIVIVKGHKLKLTGITDSDGLSDFEIKEEK